MLGDIHETYREDTLIFLKIRHSMLTKISVIKITLVQPVRHCCNWKSFHHTNLMHRSIVGDAVLIFSFLEGYKTKLDMEMMFSVICNITTFSIELN